ncbi:unnamed protein product [Ceutorhynchus assimilis]|uniref:Uncharacterized protein n=1 Tax=Ceutorhynchus assimilis TaxID=467358 RepID=A0A9N9MPZ3_9CUCU|nr:unnamed protein product [Ceutorhynchus assimilis]
MDLPQSKLFALVSLGVGSLLAGLLPACFTKQSRRQWPLFLSCLLCFGGGVLLSTSLVHILPEAREATTVDYQHFAELFFCIGFFLLYLMDEIVHYFYGETAGHSHQHDNGAALPGTDHYSRQRHPSAPNYGTYNATQTERGALLRSENQPPYNPNFFRAKSDSVLFCDEPPSQLCHVMHQEPCQTTAPTANLGLLVALSVHSLLEGLVVGLEGLPSKVLLLLGAIASHKLVVGFCLGVELACNSHITFCRHFVCILVFTASSLGGIFAGILISHIPSDVVDVVIPILQSLAGGTLLYVTVSEVLPRERARWHHEHARKGAGMAQLVSVLVGFAMMTVLSKYLDH